VSAAIRTGIGGWNYPPWRGSFYPQGLRQKDELAFASRALGTIEINATFHKLQKPETFRDWASQAPDGFVFALKGSRFITNRRDLRSAAGEPLGRFLGSGLIELGEKLGPICWQLATTKRFDAEEIAEFFRILPPEQAGVPLRHAIEVGHESFACAEFVTLARAAGVAIAYVESEDRPAIADRTADFVYARFKRMQPELEEGYAPRELDRIAGLARIWARGEVPDLPYLIDPALSRRPTSGVLLFCINGAKIRAPAAAQAIAKRVA
jgi:uncharacterized protein YecE (DUF72 family)